MDRRSELIKKKLCLAVGQSVRHLKLRRGSPEQVMSLGHEVRDELGPGF